MMKIDHNRTQKGGTFFINESGNRLAELAYHNSAPGVITVFHTEVDPTLRGEGIGKDLISEVVKYARENELKIEPTCPYAKKVIVETPAFQDVVA